MIDKKIKSSGKGRGGIRPGAGRPAGTKTSNNETTFYARCTYKEKILLKEFLEQIREKIINFN